MNPASVIFLIIFCIIYFLLLAFLLAYTVAVYILQALGLSRMARKCDMARPWLAWIPYANVWTIGAIADHANLCTRGKKTNFRTWLLTALIVVSSISIVGGGIIGGAIGATTSLAGPEPSVNDTEFMTVFIIVMVAYFLFLGLVMLLAIAQAVLLYLALYRVFTLFSPEKGKVWFWVTVGSYIGSMTVLPVLSCVVGLVQSIAILVLSKHDPVIPQVSSNAEAPEAEAVYTL